MAGPRKRIIALVAYIWLLSSVCFKMHPKISCMKGCIIALVAFVWPPYITTIFYIHGSFYTDINCIQIICFAVLIHYMKTLRGREKWKWSVYILSSSPIEQWRHQYPNPIPIPFVTWTKKGGMVKDHTYHFLDALASPDFKLSQTDCG